MAAGFIWAWDSVTGAWKKLLVDAAGHLQADILTSALPSGAATSAKQDTELSELQAKLETGDLSIEAVTKYLNCNVKAQPDVAQSDPSLLKHTPHGRVAGNGAYKPFETDSNGRLLITLSNLAKLDDIDDVNVPSPTDGYVLYWDATAGKFQVKAVYTAYTQGARAYHSAAQAIATDTWTTLAFNSERYDTDTIHDTVTNNSRLTCKTAGKYLIICNIQWGINATGSRHFKISHSVDGSIGYTTGPAQPSPHNTMMIVATIWDMEVNEYVIADVYQDSGGSLNIDAASPYSPEFMMQRIG